jgi:Holliday junction resolvasome RuvABC endonuclease subunit
MMSPANEKRVVAIDPTHRGFGYIVLEGPERLIDWGITHVQGARNKASIAAAGDLISHYRPQIMVLEDAAERNCRRHPRVRQLIEALEHYGRERGLTVRKIARTTVKKTFLLCGIRNKNQMAQFIVVRFSELARYVPPERKPWMSEDTRMAIFDAAAFALVFLGRANCLESHFGEIDTSAF